MSDEEPPARNTVFAVIAGVVAGALITLPALFVAVISAGAGHGDYVAARLLFPFPMLLTVIDGSIGVPSIVVALLQFPLYGALLGLALCGRSWRPFVVIVPLHFVAVMACFSGLIPNFS
jgi:hypothetical protein